MKLWSTATSATQHAKKPGISSFFKVAVLKTTATRTATYCYLKIIKKGGIQVKNTAPTIQGLRKQLGPEYRICTIDFERCLYRDFGNGFNVEISGANSRRAGKKVNLYLWYGTETGSCLIVKKVYDVERTAEAIGSAVDNLKDYSDALIRHGYDNRDAIFLMLNPEFKNIKKED